MRKIVKCFFLFLLYYLTLLSFFVYAKGKGTTSASFLKLGISARQTAIGEAFSGLADDSEALRYNPAGLGFIENKEVSFSHVELFEGIRYESVSFLYPFTFATAGINISVMHLKLTRVIPDASAIDGYKETGEFSSGSQLGIVGLGKKIGQSTSAGLNIKFIRESLDDKSAIAFAGDAGILFRFEEIHSIGISFLNFGTKLKFISVANSLPICVTIGYSVIPIKEKLTLSSEIREYFDDTPEIRVGAEYFVLKNLILRSGYKLKTKSNKLGMLWGLSGGIGFKLQKFYIDYAFLPGGDMGFSHRATVGVKF